MNVYPAISARTEMQKCSLVRLCNVAIAFRCAIQRYSHDLVSQCSQFLAFSKMIYILRNFIRHRARRDSRTRDSNRSIRGGLVACSTP